MIFDYESLNPGVRGAVRLLHQWGFETCDSGDGMTGDHECDREGAYIVIVSTPETLAWDADRLKERLEGIEIDVTPQGQPGPSVQANYCPADYMALIDLHDLSDVELSLMAEEAS